MEQIIELLKGKPYQIPQVLFLHYRKLNITDQELIMLIYLLNSPDNNYNPKQISADLSLKLNQVLEIINTLSEKGFLVLDIVKKNNVRSEVIRLDYLYEKMAYLLLQKDVDKVASTTIFDTFEKELGRQLSPSEIETIHVWLDGGISEEILELALKEATYNGIKHLRYIDRIIDEWMKKGIKTKEDVEKNRKNFGRKKESKASRELLDYDWLNDDSEDC